MKNDRWTGGGGWAGDGRASGPKGRGQCEESAREHLPDTRGCSSPHFQASQLLSILLQSLLPSPPPQLHPTLLLGFPLGPLIHPPHSRLKGLLKFNLTLHLPEALEIQPCGGPGGFPRGLQALQVHLLASRLSSLLWDGPLFCCLTCLSFRGLSSGVLPSGKPSL